MRKNILVIGAAGNVCMEVIKILSTKDVNLRVAARNPERAKAMNLPGVEIMQFDYCNPDTFDPVFVNIDNWLLVSPPAHLNLQACVCNVIDHAKSVGVKHVIDVSSLGIHDDTHPMRIIEDHIEKSGMDYTFLRPNCYMQYFNSYFRQSIVEDDVIRVPAGNAKTSFVDMRDVAEAAVKLLMQEKQDNRTYTLTGREALNMENIAFLLSEVLGREIKFNEVSEDDYRLMLEIDGWMGDSINASIDLCRFVKQGWNAIITSDVYSILGREPITFRDYAKDYAHFWKEPVPHAE